jgi:thymidylate synthase (FAD)
MQVIKSIYVDHMGSDLSIVNAARVSYGKNHDVFDEDKDAKLIRFLAKHKHMSPFGHAFATFHVVAPVFVARQLVKHKFLRWNEISRRYVSTKPEYFEPTTWRAKVDDKKQGSSESIIISDIHISTTLDYVTSLYKHMIDSGVCEEQARMVLPQNTMTEWYWSGSLDAFADMCKLRCSKDTQYETRTVANQINTKMSELFPVSWEALTNVHS